MNSIKKVYDLIRENNGVLLTSKAQVNNISRETLSKLASQGIIERVSHGVYIIADTVDDRMFYMQKRVSKLIYSHDTALFFHKLTDRTPNKYSVTVPSTYKPSLNIRNEFRVFYIKPKLYELGIIEMKTSFGNLVKVYDAERTICDILRSRNRLDIQILNEAIKNYASLQTADYNKLYKYAMEFSMLTVVRQYLEVLL